MCRYSVDLKCGAFFVAGEALFALITYEFPVLSAKAVPDLQNFLKQWITNQ